MALLVCNYLHHITRACARFDLTPPGQHKLKHDDTVHTAVACFAFVLVARARGFVYGNETGRGNVV